MGRATPAADGERKASAMDLLVRTRTEIVVRLRS